MDFKMNAVIHRGNNYNNTLRSFQHKRMEFLEHEIRALDSEMLWLLLRLAVGRPPLLYQRRYSYYL